MSKLILKTTIFSATILLLIALVFNGCTKNEVSNSVIENEALVELRQSNEQEIIFIFPNGTQFEMSDDESSELNFTLPFGYHYIEITEDEYQTNGSGSIRCDCNSGDGGCKPFATGDYIGCFTEGCSSCTGTTSSSVDNTGKNTLEFIKVPLQTYSDSVLYALSGFSHLSGIGSIEEWMTLPFISNDFYKEVEDDIIKAIESVWEMPLDDIQLTDNTVYVPISIYDQKLLVALPVDKVDAGLMYTLRAANGFATSGKCTGCEGRCHYKSVKLGAIVYCDGCNSGCTLHTDK